MQSVADYPLDLYFHDARGIYVNLYAGSSVNWRVANVPVKLLQDTAYPESEDIQLRVEPETAVQFAVHLRIPGWLERPAEIFLNGKRAQVEARPGTFATIARRWMKGDRIDLRLPFSFRAVPVDDRNPDTLAVMRGPLMLVAVDPPYKLEAGAAALGRMSPVPGKPLEFEIRTPAGAVRMRPFYQVQREPYTTYFRRIAEA